MIPLSNQIRASKCKEDKNYICTTIPPFISEEDAKAIDVLAKGTESFIEASFGGNVVCVFLFGASLQYLWGIVRGMQFMIFLALIDAKYSGLSFFFF